jgi:hypothetical protein
MAGNCASMIVDQARYQELKSWDLHALDHERSVFLSRLGRRIGVLQRWMDNPRGLGNRFGYRDHFDVETKDNFPYLKKSSHC